MNKLNNIQKAQFINNEYKEYLKSSFRLGSDDFQDLFETKIDEEVLYKGPFLALDLPFTRGKTIRELVREGEVSSEFLKLSDIPFDRPLYSHQEASIRKINSKKNVVITTGTGSGKTECFLYPVINGILKDIEEGKSESGIRAVFLYPMNALVNDQMDRVRRILRNYPDITFGSFTGDTPENISKTERQESFDSEGKTIPPNELLSRNEMRANPPHILFTNYSMMEYLLIRPNDFSIFDPQKLTNWKYVILDEAHTYSGSLGIEISYLLKRVTGLAEKKPQFILTSATLGQKGKSENDIISFAESLTSAEFTIDDIIFSKRIHLDRDALQYWGDGDDYIQLKESIKDEFEIKKIIEKYHSVEKGSISEMLYDFLVHDENVFALYMLLKDDCKSFNDIHNHLKAVLSTDQLISLIDLINSASKNGMGLYELKYHSFVRAVNGAYVTLGDHIDLTLTKTNWLDGKKAFEVGNCKFCNSVYVIGKMVNGKNGLLYLVQNDEVDVYENYGENENIHVDYFVLNNALREVSFDEADDLASDEKLSKYIVCSQCGAIYEESNLNANKCDCDDHYKIELYKVNNDKDNEASNNINFCPCCNRRSHNGIVRTLSLGKDEGTAIISQILYQAIDNGGKEPKKKRVNLSLRLAKPKKEQPNQVKQFITFSDSRQQASFSALFFDANHTRMMQKRLIWEVIEKHGFKDIKLNTLLSETSAIIKDYDLFDNNLDDEKNAWITTLVELLKVDGSYGGEGLGLYHFELDVSPIINEIDEEEIEEFFAELGISHFNKEKLKSLLLIVFDVFKSSSAIKYTEAGLSKEEKLDYLEYRRFDNYVMMKKPRNSKKKNVRSFLPVTSANNAQLIAVCNTCGCDEDTARRVLEQLFDLGVQSELFTKAELFDGYQIHANKYILKNYRNSEYYCCDTCGMISPYNVNDRCIRSDCNGTLHKIDPDQHFAKNYYRRQYKTKKIERISIKEHTAQITRSEAKKYQNDFKNQKINILSCSTTFEMGVDIGGLETVFMRNVPPTPANYVQRAGRAGRRQDSSAFVITYCGVSSHDYTYFTEPEKMISGVINPPYFDVSNRKIVLRHLMASSLGFFFRKEPQYFSGQLESLVFDRGIEKFDIYMKEKPGDLISYIDQKVLPESVLENFSRLKWYDQLDSSSNRLMRFKDSIIDQVAEYETAIKNASDEREFEKAAFYQRQIGALKNRRVLDSLSDFSVIPKYGFPVDVVELKIYEQGVPVSKFDLNRDLKVAITEYAPDSEVISDKQKFTSKYITLPLSNGFPKNHYCECDNCKKINIANTPYGLSNCKYCGNTLDSFESNYFIDPSYGFKTGENKESSRMKPKRSYAGDLKYIGEGVKDKHILDFGNLLSIETSSEDKLLIMNKSDFYSCSLCGYTDIAHQKSAIPKKTVKHITYKGYTCQSDTLDKIHLGHFFRTDVARFNIPYLSKTDSYGYPKALSFMYALLEGISISFNIERRDIDGIVEVNSKTNSYDILIFDNVAGGAGHVKRLINTQAMIESLKAARSKMGQNCCDDDTSCYNCLRNYNNQSYHSILKRKYSLEVLDHLLNGLSAEGLH